MHHTKADIDGLHVKRKEGGKGVLQFKATYKGEVRKSVLRNIRTQNKKNTNL